jgi:hypothetical protein
MFVFYFIFILFPVRMERFSFFFFFVSFHFKFSVFLNALSITAIHPPSQNTWGSSMFPPPPPVPACEKHVLFDLLGLERLDACSTTPCRFGSLCRQGNRRAKIACALRWSFSTAQKRLYGRSALTTHSINVRHYLQQGNTAVYLPHAARHSVTLLLYAYGMWDAATGCGPATLQHVTLRRVGVAESMHHH